MISGCLKSLPVALLLLCIPACVYFEPQIRAHIPAYSSTLFFSGMLCFCGLIYALLARNFLIAVITILVTVALPRLVVWIVIYWPL